MWLLLSKDRDIFALQQQLLAGGILPHLPVRLPRHTLLMVLGEGSVFLVLPIPGARQPFDIHVKPSAGIRLLEDGTSGGRPRQCWTCVQNGLRAQRTVLITR